MKPLHTYTQYLITALFLFLISIQPFYGQRKKRSKPVASVSYPNSVYESLSYRSIGPFRGGRSSKCNKLEISRKPNVSLAHVPC